MNDIKNQGAKISYLQKEISQLQESLNEVEELLKYNRDAVKIYTQKLEVEKKVHDVNNSVLPSTQERSLSSGGSCRFLKNIIEHLHAENSKLLQINKRLVYQRNIAQSKALINDQIAEAAQKSENEIMDSLQITIRELQQSLLMKERSLAKYELQKGKEDKDGYHIIYKDGITLTEQNAKLYGEIQNLTDVNVKLRAKLENEQSHKKEILAINYNLTQELARLKSGQLSYQGDEEIAKPVDNTEKIIKFQQKFFTGNADSDEESEDYIPNEEVFPNKMMAPMNPSEIEKSPPAGGLQGKKMPLPKLDLSKAKKLQEMQANKAIKPANPTNNAIPEPKIQEKLSKLESDLEKMKNMYQRELTLNKIIVEENEKIKSLCKETVSINNFLIKKNYTLQQKKLQDLRKLEFYVKFYHRIHLFFTSKNLNFYQFLSFAKMNEEIVRFKEEYKTQHKNFERNKIPKKDENPSNLDSFLQKEVNISILDADENLDLSLNNEDENNLASNQVMYKNFLLKLAHDLETNQTLNDILTFPEHIQGIVNKKRERNEKKMPRSLSSDILMQNNAVEEQEVCNDYGEAVIHPPLTSIND